MAPVFRKIVWTDHSKIKMKQYGLSVSKLLQILRKPERKEKAIVPGLIAVMRTNKKFVNKTKPLIKGVWQKPAPAPGEIWIMYKDIKRQGEHPSTDSGQARKIISAWRYPGVTKPGEETPIPEDIRQELENNIYI
ncbi:MAG: hypothetical protein A2599_03700 [Candidatus Staskawiczbacteria bacterium RIFOXYD1_FULL_39_28]|uniref:Uncharacterized protein n=1 Tax=Candidatus Staskawiczbacteria bacterium RIFOXYC1_FULL_38_18 TaxID=1802229 RepID=A0A1G2JC67_9BACT|nr:MAG: hypothetical protein A2401_01580 [Candidatus Staskawiczbacteria bacterium RIFOXYC1_FULL_38_18]OGZ91542.1 MAG: hypothetical protein A2599_03700 [Candidatus Staskawiczbacteria bacterium RIFOXYD1_FULL_39_28]